MYFTTTITTSYSVLNNIKVVLIANASTAITVTLPDPAKYRNREITLTRFSSSDTANITVNTVTGNVENPANNTLVSSFAFGSAVKSLTYISDSIAWHIISSNITASTTLYKGTSTQSATGTATSYTIPHGVGTAPTFATVQAMSDDASLIKSIIYDGTNITVNYDVAPPSGSSNLVFNWLAI